VLLERPTDRFQLPAKQPVLIPIEFAASARGFSRIGCLADGSSRGARAYGQAGTESLAGRAPPDEERDEECNLSKKLYIGNLSFSTTEDELRAAFQRHGTVDSVAVITDRETGRPRGFAFVEMSEPSSAADAIRALDGSDLGGRSIKVNEAQARPAVGR